MDDKTCPEDKAGVNYSCRFCRVRLHSGDDPCFCSTYRPLTEYATLCIPCAKELDILTAGTRLGRIHQRLVRDAMFTFAHDDN